MQEETFRGCSGGCANCPRMQQCMAAQTPLDAFLRANPKRGILRIQAFRGPQSVPVEGGRVTVSRSFDDGSSHIFYEGTTDRSGIIDPISLPAPELAQSLSPGDAHPSATYTVRAEYPGLEPVEATVDLYPGIKTVQPLQLQVKEA